jgi:hypothetical protein
MTAVLREPIGPGTAPAKERAMKFQPDPTLLAMIISTGLLIAWAYTNTRPAGDFDLRSGIAPVIPSLLDGE